MALTLRFMLTGAKRVLDSRPMYAQVVVTDDCNLTCSYCTEYTSGAPIIPLEELKRRIDTASRYLALDQIALAPQCGFASGIAGNMLSEDEQWRKLDVIRETARQVWG